MPDMNGHMQLITRVTAAEDSAKSWQHRYKELEEEGARRQESYMRREEGMQALINDLKAGQGHCTRVTRVQNRLPQLLQQAYALCLIITHPVPCVCV